MEDLEWVRKRWLADEPRYAAFGAYLKQRLEAAMRGAGVPAQVTARTKDVDSLLKKLIRKPHHSYASLGDRLGARIVVRRLADIRRVREIVVQHFACGQFEDTGDRLAEDQVGYLSVHVDIALRSDDALAIEFSPESFRAELQIRTLAQNVWSEMAHDTSYKSGKVVNHELKRELHLLAALVEVADKNFQRVEDQIATLPNIPELQVLRALERQYYKFASRKVDVELSMQVIHLLWPLYGRTPDELAVHFELVFAQNREFFEKIFDEAALTLVEQSAFLFQPEVLMIYDQLNTMPYRLRPVWTQEFPEKELERIALRFGFSFE